MNDNNNEDQNDSTNLVPQDQFSADDYENANKCAPWAHTNMNHNDKVKAANMFGENWANILAGLGDQ